MRDDTVRPRVSGLGRRDLIKLGAGVVTTALAGSRLDAQRGGGPQNTPPPGSMPNPDEPRPHTGPGYNNDYNRLAGNGPMDDTTRTIVKFVHDFKDSDITPSALKAVNRTMIDSVAASVAGI